MRRRTGGSLNAHCGNVDKATPAASRGMSRRVMRTSCHRAATTPPGRLCHASCARGSRSWSASATPAVPATNHAATEARPGPNRLPPPGGSLDFHAVLTRNGMPKLAWMDRPSGQVIRRWEHDRPGDLVHVDIKKLGKIPPVGGWRVNRLSPWSRCGREPSAVTASRPRQRREQGKRAPPAGLEPATRCLEGNRSFQLSYGGLNCTSDLHLWVGSAVLERARRGCGEHTANTDDNWTTSIWHQPPGSLLIS